VRNASLHTGNEVKPVRRVILENASRHEIEARLIRRT
jgi:hypothetical protein